MEELLQLEHIVRGQYTEWCFVERRMWMLFTLLLTALTATSGEDTHYSEGEGHLLRDECVLIPFRSSWQWQSGRGG